jgi:hypothetical protein
MKLLILSAGMALTIVTLWLWHESHGRTPPEPIAPLRPDLGRRAVDASPHPVQARAAPSPVIASAQPAPQPAAGDEPVPSPTPTIDDQRAHLQARFATEAVDSRWASTARQELNEDLGRVGSKDVRLHDVECHSSLCRVELNLISREAGSAFVESWLQQRAWRGPGFVANLDAGPGGDLKMVMFLGRPGTELSYSE